MPGETSLERRLVLDWEKALARNLVLGEGPGS